jgi:hypothetical protein
MSRLRGPIAVALVAMTAAAQPVNAQDPAPRAGVEERAERAFREGAEMILQALELLIGSIPQYEAPEVLENGDIIIRRKRREPAPEQQKSPGAGDDSSI